MSNKQGRGFSTEFEDHKGLLHRFSKRSFAALCEFQIPIDYEDVFQEACIGYTLARDGYKPELGFTFSAYMGRSVLTHLQRHRERLIRERVKYGMFSVNDMLEDEEGDYIEIHCGATASTEDEYIAAVEAEQRMRNLSPKTRNVVAKLVREVVTGDKDRIQAREIFRKAMDDCAVHRLNRPGIYKELFAVYEVEPRPAKTRQGQCEA